MLSCVTLYCRPCSAGRCCWDRTNWAGPDNSSVGWFVGFSDQSSSHLRKNISQQHLPVVKSYTGQHSQFLRCFSNTHLRILINYTAQSAHSALKRIFLWTICFVKWLPRCLGDVMKMEKWGVLQFSDGNWTKASLLPWYLSAEKRQTKMETFMKHSLAWTLFLSGWKQVVTTHYPHIHKQLKKCNYWCTRSWRPFRRLLTSSFTPLWDGQAMWPLTHADNCLGSGNYQLL